MSTSGQTLAPGTVIDSKYRIEAYIGRGGLGAVYRAIHRSAPGAVALKVLREKYCRDVNAIERFLDVAIRAAAIGHENIGDITDHGLHEGAVPYLVMPLFEGRSLKKMIRERDATLTRGRIVEIFRQTLSALDAAHAAGISHRDLMPGNIFITSHERGDCVKLLDFGIAEIIESDTVTEHARAGTIIGTPYYRAPEQIRGVIHSDPHVDIYAAGVILYEALTGQLPYEGRSYNEVLFKIMAGPFLSPSRVASDIPHFLEAIILKAMAKDPAARFSSAAEMRDAFDEQDERPSSERLTSRPTAATVSDLPFVPDGALFPSSESSFAPSRPPTLRRKSYPPVQNPLFFLKKKAVLAVILAALVISGGLIAFFIFSSKTEPVTVPLHAPETQSP